MVNHFYLYYLLQHGVWSPLILTEYLIVFKCGRESGVNAMCTEAWTFFISMPSSKFLYSDNLAFEKSVCIIMYEDIALSYTWDERVG